MNSESAKEGTDRSVARRPKILCLVHRVPYPPNRGDRIRSYHLLRFLAARADVSLAFLAQDAMDRETAEALGGLCQRVAAVPWRRWSRWLRATGSMAAGRTATEGLFRSSELNHVVRTWSEQTRFDLAFIFCSSMVQYLDAPGLTDVPVVVDLVDVDSQKWLDYARHSRTPMRWLFQMEGNRLRRLEALLPDRVEAVTVVSLQEADLFQSFCPSDRVHPVLNGVDLDYFQPDTDCDGSSCEQCVFVGALDYRANLDGVTWFCHEVWHRVRQRHPQATFRLVGSNPGPAARKLARQPGVELVGQVPDVRPHLKDAALAVVPLQVARGIQNKVLEAMAMAKPVVVSPQALEGIDATPDVHLCRAATADEWARAIGTLLSDPERRSRLGGAAREFVEQRFQWKRRLQPLAALPGVRDCLRQQAGN